MCQFIVSTNAILENLYNVKKSLDKNTKICAIVKANAYGFGASKICVLIKNCVDYYAVARLSEFLKFKEYEIDKPCLILTPLYKKELVVAIKNDAEITISVNSDIDFINDIAKNWNKTVKVHLKIDTGMSRYGFKDFCEIEKALNKIKTSENIKLVGCYSHFLNSANNVVTIRQRELFEKVKVLIEKFWGNCLFHLSNSNGIKDKKNIFNMVRLGFDLYNSNEHKFITNITEIKNLQKGDTVSYNGLFKAKKQTKVAVCGVGYADGLSRLHAKGYVLINGKKAKILGSICMDAIIVDITGIDALVGDEVVIFGKSKESMISVCDLAKECGTIPYEIYTSISSRVKRVYRWRNYASYSRKVQGKKIKRVWY